MKKKVLLIVPPVTVVKDRSNFNITFPMGLGYIAAVLENATYEVVVLDSVVENINMEIPMVGNPNFIQVGITFDEIRNFIIECCPDFVGITSMFSTQANNAYHVAELVKSVKNEIPVIFGGAHATAEPEQVLKNKNIDFVVLGEGENVIVPLLKAIERKKDLSKLDSIAFRGKQGKIVYKPKTSFVDVNKLPYPARHLFPVEKYFSSCQRHGIRKIGETEFRSLPILTSRGCPFKCNFCSAYQLFGRKFRFREVESVLNEIDELVKKYKVEDIYLSDDQFLFNRKRVMGILDGIIERKYKITFDDPNGISPWLLDEEIIKKMKGAGFWRACLAVESGNELVLKKMINKPVQIDKLPKLVKLLREYKLEVHAFLVVGNISEEGVETFSQMEDSFKLMRQLKISKPAVSFLSPHPGSVVFEIAKRKGYINSKYTDSYYNEPSISTPLWSNEELKMFVTIQCVLCNLDYKFLHWPIRMFIKNFKGFLLKRRYKFIYNLYLSAKKLRSAYSNRFLK